MQDVGRRIQGPLRRSAAALAAPAVLLAFVVLFHWKLVLTDEYTWLDGPDIARQVLPWYQFQAREWNQGRFPLWDPYSWFGQPLVGQIQPGAVYPPNWLLFCLPLENGRIRPAALHWYLVLIHGMAALFAYWLCRDLNLARTPAVFGGLFFSLGGFLGSIDWPQMLNGAVWAPLVFLYLLRAGRGDRPARNAALAGFFLGVAWLSGHHQLPIYISLAASALWLWHLAAGPFRRRRAAHAALFAAMALTTSAAQTLPAYEYAKRSVRWAGVETPLKWDEKIPYKVHHEYSLKGRSLLGILLPNSYVHSNPYTGAAVLSAVLAALALAWRAAEVRVFFWMAAGGLLLSLGSEGFLHGMLYAVAPLVEKARSPSMAILLWHLAVSVLAAFGLAKLRHGDAPRWLPCVPFAFAAVTGGTTLALAVAGKPVANDSFVAAGFLALLTGAALSARRRRAIGANLVMAALFGISLTELSLSSSTAFLASRYDTERTSVLAWQSRLSQMVNYLRTRPEPARVQVDEAAVPFNFGLIHGIETSAGYLASLTANVTGIPLWEERLRRLAGVRYAIAAAPPAGRWAEVFEEDGLRLFSDQQALPVARTVHEVTSLASRAEGIRALSDPGFDLSRRAFLVGDEVEVERCAGGDSVEWRSRRPAGLALDVGMACRGMVIVAGVWYPGWKATVDGKDAVIHEAYGFLRGVVVPAGKHRLEMRYRPWTVAAGGALSGIGFLAALVLGLWGGRKLRAAPA